MSIYINICLHMISFLNKCWHASKAGSQASIILYLNKYSYTQNNNKNQSPNQHLHASKAGSQASMILYLNKSYTVIHPKQQQKPITKPTLACQQSWLASITKKQQNTSKSPNHHLHASKAGSQASPKNNKKQTNLQTTTCMPAKLARKHQQIYILNDKAKSSSQTSHISFLLLQWAQLQDAMISNLF